MTPLSPAEERLWRALVRLLVILPRAIDDDLSRRAGVGLTTYVVLMHLSEAPCRQLRLGELAERCAISPSRVTRVVDALERDALVVRVPSRHDQRSSLAQLTDAGLERLRQAWPGHLAGVRELVMDHLDDHELPQVSDVLRRLIAAVEADRADPCPLPAQEAVVPQAPGSTDSPLVGMLVGPPARSRRTPSGTTVTD